MNPPSRPEHRQTRDEIDLLALLGNLWAGRVWILAAALITLLLGTFLVLRATPIYQANALIQLEARMGALALPEGMQELLGGDSKGTAAVETETEILKSRMVIGEAVRELDLQTKAYARPFPVLGQLPKRLDLPDLGLLPSREWGNEHIRVTRLEVPDPWLGEQLILIISAPGRFVLQLPDGQRLEGVLQERLAFGPDGGGGAIIVDELEGRVGREFIVARLPLEAVVQEIQNNFTVSAASRNASMLRLSYKNPDPRQAERVLDAIARAYVGQNISRSAAEAENSLRFIEEQLPQARAAVDEAQQALNAYRQQQGSVDVDYETRSLLERATTIEAQLSALALQEEDIRKRYTTNHPTYQLLLENRASLERELESIRQDTASLPETQKEIFNLTRNLTVAEQGYTQLLNRSQELQVLRASTVGSVRIIDTAFSNGSKISPRTSQTLALSLALGILVGMGVVLLHRFLRRGIRGAEEIERMGLPVFGTINFAPDAVNLRRKKGILPIHAITRPDDLVVEALRSLRTALHFGMLDAKTNSVLLTSAAPGTGKSFTAINLAVVAAQAGQRVCLIDADLRRGYLRRYLGKERKTPGLAEYLAREHSLDEVLLDGPADGLSVILTGRFPPNPSELLMRAEFEELLKILNERFDLILIDSPPALAVTDPVIIGRYVGATIAVVRHMETMAGEVEAVRHTFETAGAKVTGAILNGYRQEEGARYGGYYQYYNYRYSYQTDKD